MPLARGPSAGGLGLENAGLWPGWLSVGKGSGAARAECTEDIRISRSVPGRKQGVQQAWCLAEEERPGHRCQPTRGGWKASGGEHPHPAWFSKPCGKLDGRAGVSGQGSVGDRSGNSGWGAVCVRVHACARVCVRDCGLRGTGAVGPSLGMMTGGGWFPVHGARWASGIQAQRSVTIGPEPGALRVTEGRERGPPPAASTRQTLGLQSASKSRQTGGSVAL